MSLSTWWRQLWRRNQDDAAPVAGDTPVLLSSGHAPDQVAEVGAMLLRSLEQSWFDWLLGGRDIHYQTVSKHGQTLLRELLHDWQQPGGIVGTLPRRPSALPQLLRLMNNTDANRDELVQAITQDPALTDRVLQVANSPYFRAGQKPVETLGQAVFLLGNEGLRNAASSALLQPLMSPNDAGEKAFAARSWQWGLGCARASEVIARLASADAGAFFLLGLLPALSDLLVYREVARRYRLKDPRLLPESPTVMVAIRTLRWRCCMQLAESWNLPPRYHAHLLEALRPGPVTRHTPLNDGMILATWQVLKQQELPAPDPKLVAQALRIAAGNLPLVLNEISVAARA